MGRKNTEDSTRGSNKSSGCKNMKEPKIMLLIKNVDMELMQKIQKVINQHNALKRVEDGKA